MDTVGADPSVMAIELERGSDLIGVEATNQPGSAAFSVVGTCGRGSVIQRSTITGTDEDSAVFSSDGLRVIESTLSSEATSTPALFQLPNDLPGTQLRVKRSHVIAPEDSPAEAVFGGSKLVLDSSLITGGNIGAYTVGDADVNNTTIDPGEPGASPSAPTPSMVFDSFFDPTQVSVESSILVGELVASPGAEGQAGCEFTDLPSADETTDFPIDCGPAAPATPAPTPTTCSSVARRTTGISAPRRLRSIRAGRDPDRRAGSRSATLRATRGGRPARPRPARTGSATRAPTSSSARLVRCRPRR